MPPVPTPWIDREYLALCIAEQIVRGVTGAAAPMPAGASGVPRRAAGGDLLISLAEALDLRERVSALVVEALGHAR